MQHSEKRPVRRLCGRRVGRLAYLVIGLVLGSIALAASAREARAGDYDDKDISLRLASGFIRFTEVSAFGGETAANRWSPAVNPASADWTKLPGRNGLVIAPYYSHLSFDAGMKLNLYGQAASWDTRRAGTFVPTTSQLRSNNVPDRTGLGFDYKTDTYQLMWGKRLNSWAVGAMANYNESSVVQSAGPIPVRSTTAETWRFRLGGLYEPCCKLMFGLVGEYAHSPYDFKAVTPTPAGPLPIAGKDTLDHYVVRAGASYEYKPLCSVYLDYQYATFQNQTGRLDVQRLQSGVQHRFTKFLWLRGAVSTDKFFNVGGMAGISAAFARWGQVHIGYQRGVLPELESNFGQSDVFQFTLSLNF